MSLNKPFWKLRDWIDESKLNWDYLSRNPNALHLLEQNQDKIKWDLLSKIHLYLNWIMKP